MSTCKVYRVVLFLLMLGFNSFVAQAQRNAYWIEGKVTFKNGETQYGVLNYDATVSEGLLQVKNSQRILTYTVKDVESFSFFDDHTEQWRRFYAFPLYLVQGGVVRDFFMEVVYRGKQWSILRKKERWAGSLAYQKLSPESYVLQRPKAKLKYARYHEICYLLNMETGEIEEMTKELFLTSLSSQAQKLKDYRKETRLRLHTIEDYITLLDYYHQLSTVGNRQSGVTGTPVRTVLTK